MKWWVGDREPLLTLPTAGAAPSGDVMNLSEPGLEEAAVKIQVSLSHVEDGY